MSEMPELIWAYRWGLDLCNSGWSATKPSSVYTAEATEYVRADIATLSSAAVAEREPVAFLIERLAGAGYGSPRSIVDAAKYDPRRDEFWNGDAKSRHLVTPLYPPASELEALRKVNIGLHDEVQFMREKAISNARERNAAEARLAEALRALNLIDALDPEEHVYGCSADALRGIVIQMGQIARRVREGGKVDG